MPDAEKWKYGAISVAEDATVYVTNLTSKNPRSYHITGCAERSIIHVSQCNLLDTRAGVRNNSDGFGAAAGSSIRDSFISTSDDAIKIYHDMTIERVTIEQHRNGAPISGSAGATIFLDRDRNDYRLDHSRRGAPQHQYNMGADYAGPTAARAPRNLRINGLHVSLDGALYLDDQDSALISTKVSSKLLPPSCALNFFAENAIIDPPVMGVKRTQGKPSRSFAARPPLTC